MAGLGWIALKDRAGQMTTWYDYAWCLSWIPVTLDFFFFFSFSHPTLCTFGAAASMNSLCWAYDRKQHGLIADPLHSIWLRAAGAPMR